MRDQRPLFQTCLAEAVEKCSPSYAGPNLLSCLHAVDRRTSAASALTVQLGRVAQTCQRAGRGTRARWVISRGASASLIPRRVELLSKAGRAGHWLSLLRADDHEPIRMLASARAAVGSYHHPAAILA